MKNTYTHELSVRCLNATIGKPERMSLIYLILRRKVIGKHDRKNRISFSDVLTPVMDKNVIEQVLGHLKVDLDFVCTPFAGKAIISEAQHSRPVWVEILTKFARL